MDLAARTVLVTADDRGPLINIAAWITMVTMCLAVFTRLGSKYIITRRFGSDDALVAVSLVFAVGQTIALSIEVANGLGKRIDALNASQIQHVEQAAYASEFLYIMALCFVKGSCLACLAHLAPIVSYLRVTNIIVLVTVLWTISGLFSVAFQCSLPNPWSVLTSHCFNQNAFWDVFGAVDILIDLCIILLPLKILWRLHLPATRRVVIIAAFSSRVLVIPVTVLRLVYIGKLSRSPDPTFSAYDTAIITQIQMNLSIFISCIPYLKPFLEGLDSGLLTSDVRRRNIHHGSYASGSFQLRDMSKDNSGSSGTRDSKGKRRQEVKNGRHGNEAIVTAGSPVPDTYLEDIGSRKSSMGSERMIIKQTQEWRISHDQASPPVSGEV